MSSSDARSSPPTSEMKPIGMLRGKIPPLRFDVTTRSPDIDAVSFLDLLHRKRLALRRSRQPTPIDAFLLRDGHGREVRIDHEEDRGLSGCIGGMTLPTSPSGLITAMSSRMPSFVPLLMTIAHR